MRLEKNRSGRRKECDQFGNAMGCSRFDEAKRDAAIGPILASRDVLASGRYPYWCEVLSFATILCHHDHNSRRTNLEGRQIHAASKCDSALGQRRSRTILSALRHRQLRKALSRGDRPRSVEEGRKSLVLRDGSVWGEHRTARSRLALNMKPEHAARTDSRPRVSSGGAVASSRTRSCDAERHAGNDLSR